MSNFSFIGAEWLELIESGGWAGRERATRPDNSKKMR